MRVSSSKTLLLCIFLVGCGTNSTPASKPSPKAPEPSTPLPLPLTAHPFCLKEEVVKATPQNESAFSSQGFDKYAEIIAPNGKAIKLFAQNQVSKDKLRRAHSLMSFFLQNAPASQYGSDKSEVANSMANNEAILIMPNGSDTEGNQPNLPGQLLFGDETPMEGSEWFMQNNWDHRDAAFEEIFHLVHDMGIGTNSPGARPEYQSLLSAEANKAIADGRWGIAIDPGITDWVEELRQEGSLAQEYIAAVIDSYYGLWGAFEEQAGGMWGIYIAKTREEIEIKDSEGKTLLEAFLPPTLDYQIHLAEELEGTFSLAINAELPYTHKTQYMVHVTLTGNNPVSIIGNSYDNTLRGNTADNTLEGGAGNDTVVYCSLKSEHTLKKNGNSITVSGPNGTDTLTNVETIHFADEVLSTSDLQAEP